jgi:hypothetical protein
MADKKKKESKKKKKSKKRNKGTDMGALLSDRQSQWHQKK